MASYEKWIAGGLGWAFLGPVGGLIGFALGALLDRGQQPAKGMTTEADFKVSLLILIAAILKADGKVLRSELDIVKLFLVRHFGEDNARDALQLLKELLSRDIPVDEVCQQMNQNLDYPSKLELMHLLFNIAIADQLVTEPEWRLIERIASLLGIQQADLQSIKSMFIEDSKWAYQTLEIESSATVEEIKKAYRKMALKFHPDRVIHLGEDVQKSATERFRKVSDAYEKLKKERNFS